jgi:hypothetical protein|tara:strand:- start:2909 stop:3196 length:288 start_codon:yes stop_codon:yes gene_type:complete
MGACRVKLGSSTPKKVRKLRNGSGFSGRINLGAGSPTRYSGTSGRIELKIPFNPRGVKKRTSSVEASVDRSQGLGRKKGVPSIMLGGKYKYNFGN